MRNDDPVHDHDGKVIKVLLGLTLLGWVLFALSYCSKAVGA